ncbi:hypothetical protein STEG23_014588 [Scotinomys teguina]
MLGDFTATVRQLQSFTRTTDFSPIVRDRLLFFTALMSLGTTSGHKAQLFPASEISILPQEAYTVTNPDLNTPRQAGPVSVQLQGFRASMALQPGKGGGWNFDDPRSLGILESSMACIVIGYNRNSMKKYTQKNKQSALTSAWKDRVPLTMEIWAPAHENLQKLSFPMPNSVATLQVMGFLLRRRPGESQKFQPKTQSSSHWLENPVTDPWLPTCLKGSGETHGKLHRTGPAFLQTAGVTQGPLDSEKTLLWSKLVPMQENDDE